MARAATDVMQSIIFSAVLEGIGALKRASGGLPNQLLRDVQAIHPNVTQADLPKELQDQIAESTRAAFTQLLKEGYAVGPRQQMQQSRPIDRVPDRDRRGPPRGPGSGDRRGGRPLKGAGPDDRPSGPGGGRPSGPGGGRPNGPGGGRPGGGGRPRKPKGKPRLG